MIQYRYKLSCIDISNTGIYQLSCMIYPCFDLNTAYYVYCVMTDAVVVCQFYSSVTVWLSTKHDGFGKRLCLSAKISNTVSCNISLYRDTKEVIYRYTQNVHRPISTRHLLCGHLIRVTYISHVPKNRTGHIPYSRLFTRGATFADAFNLP